MLGLGVMLQSLGSNKKTLDAIKSSLGKEIKILKLEDNDLIFMFKDGSSLTIWDDGQSCCEDRYMSTDDDLTEYIESKLLALELKEAPNIENGGEEHEVQFLDVLTSKGIFTISNHNEHNGYYSGFYIKAIYQQ